MNEELKSKLADLIKGTEYPSSPDHYFKILMEFGQAAYDMAKADEWVSVETTLPDETTDVEFYNAGYKAHFIGRLYDKERKIFWDQQADTHTKVTHWKHLTPPNQ